MKPKRVKVVLDYMGNMIDAIVEVPSEYITDRPFDLKVRFKNLLECQPIVRSLELIPEE